MIYLDNAATTRIDEEVLQAMLPFLREGYGNPQSQHAFGREAANAVISARDKIAYAAGCAADELYFTSGGTECGNTALKGVCSASGRGRILVSAIEHPALLESAKDMQKHGFAVDFVYPDASGRISPQSVKDALKPDTVFCAVMAANNETGVVQPVEEIGAVCREAGAFYYVDCVQSACYLPLPVGKCDAFGISAHKFYGPKGAGALYVKKGAKISRLISGGMQERGFRGGTVNAAAVVGMAEAYAKARKNAAAAAQKVGALRDGFVKRVLSEIGGASLNGGGEILPSHANISFEGCDGENILFALDMKGVAVSTGSACSAGAVTPSHVLLAMGLGESRAKSAVRFTFGKYNTADEAEKTVETLKAICVKIRCRNA